MYSFYCYFPHDLTCTAVACPRSFVSPRLSHSIFIHQVCGFLRLRGCYERPATVDARFFCSYTCSTLHVVVSSQWIFGFVPSNIYSCFQAERGNTSVAPFCLIFLFVLLFQLLPSNAFMFCVADAWLRHRTVLVIIAGCVFILMRTACRAKLWHH